MFCVEEYACLYNCISFLLNYLLFLMGLKNFLHRRGDIFYSHLIGNTLWNGVFMEYFCLGKKKQEIWIACSSKENPSLGSTFPSVLLLIFLLHVEYLKYLNMYQVSNLFYSYP